MKEELESKDQKCLMEAEENVEIERGNEAEGKVSKLLADGIFGDRVKEDATLSKIHINNQDGLQRKAVPGKDLQVEFKKLPVSMDTRQRVSARGGVAETQEQFTQRLKRRELPYQQVEGRQIHNSYDVTGKLQYHRQDRLNRSPPVVRDSRGVIGVEHVGVSEKYHGGIKDKGRCDAGWRNAIHSSPDETGSVQRLSSSPLKMQRSSSSKSGVRNPCQRGEVVTNRVSDQRWKEMEALTIIDEVIMGPPEINLQSRLHCSKSPGDCEHKPRIPRCGWANPFCPGI
ncbi:hypothetical protein DY000_02032645 [Brassica cretica]|uniref:Uncharacterized protein n=1 Tax=Brassica cretica TaxID=69181 RepID=A0ABQ7DEN5_BRACR|nr:hypothetical protein DY000_02032645 [Brassica cretica]